MEKAYKELLDQYRDYNRRDKALAVGNKVWFAQEGSINPSFRQLAGKEDCVVIATG